MSSLKSLFIDKLGVEKPLLSRVTAIFLCLLTLFYVFYTSSFLHLDVFVLENRVMYDVTIVKSFYIINETLDTIFISCVISILSLLIFNKKFRIGVTISLVTLFFISFVTHAEIVTNVIILFFLPSVIMLSISQYFWKTKILSEFSSVSLSYTYFCILIMGIGFFSLGLSFLKILGIIDLNTFPKDYLYNLFVIVSRFSPFIVIAISFVLFLNIISNYLQKKLFFPRFSLKKKIVNLNSTNQLALSSTTGFILLLIIVLSILLPLIPQLHTINPENRYIGVDTFWYVNWTGSFNHNDPVQLFNNAFRDQSHGDRPVALFIIYLISRILPLNIGDAIDSMPVFLSPILTLISFFLAREFTNNIKVSLLISFLTVLSFQVLVGIYAGFYANWLGLIFGNIVLFFFLRYLKTRSGYAFVFFSIFLFLLVLVHVYTWSIYAITIFIFSLISLRLQIFSKKVGLLILLVLGLTLVFDFTKDLLIGSSGGLHENVKLTEEFIGFNNLSILTKNIYESVLISHGGIFGNGITLILVLAVSLSYLNMRKATDLLLLSFTTLLIVPIFLGYYNIQVRVLYDIPFQIPLGMAIYYLARSTKNPYLILAILILQTAIGVRTLVNFYLIE